MDGFDGDNVMEGDLFEQDPHMNPFNKWILYGVNGSCTDVAPLVMIQGGAYGVHSFTCYSQHSQVGFGDEASDLFNVSQACFRVNHTIVYTTFYKASPVCVYPHFLFVLSNNSFLNCTNETCWMSQCWDSKQFTGALVARVP